MIVNAELVPGWGGQEVRDWEHATRTPWPADVQPVSTPAEQEDRRDLTTARWWLNADLGAPLDAYSLVEWDGADKPLSVEGEVQVMHFQGQPHHVEAFLTREAEEVPSDV